MIKPNFITFFNRIVKMYNLVMEDNFLHVLTVLMEIKQRSTFLIHILASLYLNTFLKDIKEKFYVFYGQGYINNYD